MRKANSHLLILIGLVVRYLRATKNQPKEDVIASIDHINNAFETLGFHVSLKGLYELLDFRTELTNLDKNEIDASMASRLNTIMGNFVNRGQVS